MDKFSKDVTGFVDGVKKEFKKPQSGGSTGAEGGGGSGGGGGGLQEALVATVSSALQSQGPLKEIAQKAPMSFFRHYISGWSPRFNVDDAFSNMPTVRYTGRGSASDRYPTKGRSVEPQSYEEIRAECIESGALWEDPDFPATDSSIYFENPPSAWPDIEWLRPSEICDDPQLFVDGASRMDVNQGILGDCWLLAAVSCLATNEKLLHRVIPDGQSFTEEYGGVFKFEFWQYGHWVEICIDDRLPTSNGKLIYMHSDDRNEFWSALLEKAYAKLVGTYENLSGGLTSEALTDFTGGICERYELREKTPEDLFKTLLRAHKRAALMGCSIDAAPESMEAQLDNGLIIGHAYSITDVRLVNVETPRVSGQIPMVRVRNPWGDSHEWKGAWSDESEEWSMVPEDEKETLGLTYSHDGEFWMSFSDFTQEYQRLEVCYLGPDTPSAADFGQDVEDDITKWEGTLHEGGWRRRVNAGGCRNYPQTFWTNPQYRVTIDEPDDDDEDGKGSIIVGLMQKNRRKLKKEGKDNLTMGYAIYQLDDPECGTLSKRFFQSHNMAAKSPAFINLREVSDHHDLEPGHYVILPSSFAPEEEGDFILRVFSQKKDLVHELDDSTGTSDPDVEELGEDTEDDEAKTEEAYEGFRANTGEDGEVDAYELKDLLNGIFQQEFEFDGFSVDLCRSMVAMSDADMSGKLNFPDYQSLWKDLHMCKKAFKKLDEDGNGYFNSYEFRSVLITLGAYIDNLKGLRVSNSTFNAIVMRYSDREGHVKFDDFVACVIKLKTMFDTFKSKDGEGSGEATYRMDEFIQMTMYS